MYPKLFEIGPLTVYSYGLMLGLAFLTASFILNKEFKRKNINPELAGEITLYALIFGIVGAKLLSVLENFDLFLKNPFKELFSAGGLTFYGGFILAVLAIYISSKRKKLPFLVFADLASPSLALAYGIARLGCHLAGDGDYGIPVKAFASWVPWGVDYSNGVIKPEDAFSGTYIAQLYAGGFVPNNELLHPTPVYEFIFGVIIFSFLWYIRKNNRPDGKLFFYFLTLHGLARFLIELIRINPPILFGLSQAQIISIILIVSGIYGFYYFYKNPDLPRFDTSKLKTITGKKKND